MVEAMQLDAVNGRRNSIGTLTGWQLLAGAVAGSSEGQHDTANPPRHSMDQATLAGKHAGSKRPTHARSSSSNMSDDEDGNGAAATAAITPRPHQWLYKEYKIQDEIGSGGFGRVCRARRLTDGKVVVVKEIKTTSLSPKQKAATMDEVEVLAKLNHPNIVKYHDCFMDDVYINIVMEYCNAGDLAGLVKRRQGQLLPEAEVMSLFVQICLALQYVHAAGVLHRDLKTSNVLMCSSANYGSMPLLKLGDFGVAKMNSAECSMASTIVGTPQYLSPEMCDNKPYGKKSDIWALGCILYELCTLTKAFDLGNGGISGIILKIMRGTYTPIPASYSEDMKTLVASMLQTDPSARPSVMEILGAPYVRTHLAAYMDWARNVQDAHPEILVASLGESFKSNGRGGGSASGTLAKVSPRAGGSHHGLSDPGAGPSVAAGNSGQMLLPPAGAVAGAAGLALKPPSSKGSGSSLGSLNQDSLPGNAGKFTTLQPEAPYMASQPQQLRSLGETPAFPSAEQHTAKSTFGWFGQGNGQQQQQQGPAANSGSLPPPPPLQHAASGSGGSSNSTVGNLWSQAGEQHNLQNNSDLHQHSNGTFNSKQSLAQEQMEGLRRLRGLKARMQLQPQGASDGSFGSSTVHRDGHAGLATLISIDSETAHISAML